MSDHDDASVIQNGNSLKRTGRDRDGRVIILPPTTADEHIAVQRESKARTTLASSLFLMINCGLISIIMGGGNEARDDMEGSQSLVHSGFDLKTKGGTELAFFEDLYYKFEDTYVLHSLIAESEPEQQVAYEDFEQIDKLDLEEMDIKWQMAMLSVRVNKLEKKGEGNIEFDKKEAARFNKKAELGKKEADTKALITVDTLENWKEHKSRDDEGFLPKKFALMGITSEVQAYKNSLKTLEKQKRVYQQNQLGYEEKIRVLSIELENTTNLLKHSERINVEAEIAKKDLQTKLDNHLAKTEKWTSSSKNLFRLIDSSMSVRTKVGLGFDKYIGESELGWDDSEFSIFTPKSEEVEGRPLFHKFTKVDGMKAVPSPLFRNYIPLSNTTNLDETQMTYGKKSTCSIDSISVSNDFVSCDNSDKSSEIKSNDYAFCVSSVKSSEPMTADSSSNASTSSVSTHASEANLESSEGTTIQEPIIVQELPNRQDTISAAEVPNQGKNSATLRFMLEERTFSSVTSGWWQSTARPMAHLHTPTSSYFQTSTPFGPHVYYNQMHYERECGATAISLSRSTRQTQVRNGLGSPLETNCSFVHVNLHTDAGDEGIVDSGCSRSMTGNKERLDDFQPFKDGKVTFGGGEG
ncbi:hypothetical protein Tco_0449444 [Tanacetum coccineum]